MKQVRLEACPQPEDLLDIGAVKLARGETTDAMKALPEYLRENVAKKSNS
jgi:tRNA A37 threonylcarbamoyladenosine modification protein TsaB